MMLRARLLLALGVLATLFAAAVAKLFEIQVLEHRLWLETADRIQVRQSLQTQPRGRIYDRNGLLLAFDVRAISIALDNFHMTKPEILELLFQRHLGLSSKRAQELIYRPGHFTWIARKLDPEVAEKLRREAEEEGIRGLIFIPEWKRVYPQGSLASNVIGFAGLDNLGLEGIELYFDGLLRGKEEKREMVLGADGTLLHERVLVRGSPGADLYLTIDARIQHLAEKAIKEGVRRYRAKGGFAIVLDPRSGEILAMAQDKTYDLNHFERSSPSERKNLAVSMLFEPGSAFKVFAMLAALESGAIGLNERFNGNSPVVIAGHRFHNSEDLNYGPVTPAQIIKDSINTGMIRVSQRLGEKRLYEFLKSMHFGEKTGVSLPGEEPGILPPLKDWSVLEIGAIPIGQSVAVTGIQLISRYAALANGGRILTPRIAKMIPPAGGGQKRARSAQDQAQLAQDQSDGPIASSQNLQALIEMMKLVVEDGTGILAKIEGFEVAAKSGTGQKALPGQGYVKGKYTSLFAGFFPASDPQYLILVVLDEVGTQRFYGGETAGPIFKEIAEGIISLKRLKPEGVIENP